MEDCRVGRSSRGQAALDFLISYGVAILAIGIAIIALYKIGLNNSYTAMPYCNPTAEFSCGSFSINSVSGILSLSLAQDTGAQIEINGIACAADANSIGDTPGEGNIYVTANSLYYLGMVFSKNSMYSGMQMQFEVPCYGPGGVVATGQLGSSFTGYIWLNYTSPGYRVPQIQQIASINAKYT